MIQESLLSFFEGTMDQGNQLLLGGLDFLALLRLPHIICAWIMDPAVVATQSNFIGGGGSTGTSS